MIAVGAPPMGESSGAQLQTQQGKVGVSSQRAGWGSVVVKSPGGNVGDEGEIWLNGPTRAPAAGRPGGSDILWGHSA